MDTPRFQISSCHLKVGQRFGGSRTANLLGLVFKNSKQKYFHVIIKIAINFSLWRVIRKTLIHTQSHCISIFLITCLKSNERLKWIAILIITWKDFCFEFLNTNPKRFAVREPPNRWPTLRWQLPSWKSSRSRGVRRLRYMTFVQKICKFN